MKIAFISNKDPSISSIDNDGGAITPKYYALELGKLGHNIDIFTPKIIHSAAYNHYFKAKSIAQDKEIVEMGINSKVIRKPLKPINREKFGKSNETKGLVGIIESFMFADTFTESQLYDYDIVSFFHPLTVHGILNRELINKKRTVMFPMLLSEEYMKYQDISKSYCELEKIALDLVGHICSPSEHEKKTLIKMGLSASKITVINRGYDEEIFIPNIRQGIKSPSRVNISVIGAIRPQKKQDLMIPVSKELIQLGIKPKILFIGENYKFYKIEHERYYQELIRSIKDERLIPYFEFLGGLNCGKVANILHNSDIAIFPSASESYGKAVLEAIATGTPTIVCDDVSAYREFAQPSVNVLSVKRDAEEIAGKVRGLIEDSGLYSQLSSGGIKTTRKFTWKNVTKELELFYQRLRYH